MANCDAVSKDRRRVAERRLQLFDGLRWQFEFGLATENLQQDGNPFAVFQCALENRLHAGKGAFLDANDFARVNS